MQRVKTLVKICKLFHKVASGNLVNKVECWLPTITPRTHQLQRDVLQDKKKKRKLYFHLVGTVHKEDFLTRLLFWKWKSLWTASSWTERRNLGGTWRWRWLVIELPTEDRSRNGTQGAPTVRPPAMWMNVSLIYWPFSFLKIEHDTDSIEDRTPVLPFLVSPGF